MANRINQIHLPKPRKLAAMTVRIDSELKHEIQQLLKNKSSARKKIGWTALIEACLRRYLIEENKS